VRQSTLTQVIINQESLRLQYALQQRAQNLGWRAEDIEVIDADLGLTGAFAQHRSGFQELVTKVTLGQAGIILSSDVTRLSRNCSDWYPLLDVCGYRGCLIADQDGVYDPGSTNGRLTLRLERATLRIGTAYHSGAHDGWTLEQSSPRRVGFDSAGWPHP
jgi:DNA invertase Pin-like site-specific DNA recombinase